MEDFRSIDFFALNKRYRGTMFLKLYSKIPTQIKRFIRITIYWTLDTLDYLTGRKEPMVPPRMTSLIIGGGDYKKIGKDFTGYLIRYADLKSEHRVLEIGAGYGRMAAGLTAYLNYPGTYDGIEIIKKAVDWCNKEIAFRYPNFNFHHADVHNSYSNPEGLQQATEYSIPFADDTFDVVFLTSVFSHMPPAQIETYLGEIHRVLKEGGRCFITYYLLDNFALKQIQNRKASRPFYQSFEGFLSTSRKTPEDTIAIPEATIRKFYMRNNLTIVEPILYGNWAGREKYLTYQDVIIAHKVKR